MKTLDSRNLQQELSELLEQFEDWKSNLTDEQIHKIAEDLDYEVSELDEEDFLNEWDWYDADRIKAIRNLKDEISSSEWESGVQFIAENSFEEYAEQFADDIGAIDRNSTWPLNHIDWSAAADELKNDYSTVDFDGETWYYRE